jgi:excisionase family DNA binding protein
VEALIDTRGAAVLLGLKEPTIRKYTMLRILPHVKIGTRVLFRASELERFANERHVPALGKKL